MQSGAEEHHISMKEKISIYHIINMFFVGSVYSIDLIAILYKIIPFDWLKKHSELLADWKFLISTVAIIIMFEIGFLINRIGSVFISPLYAKIKIWPKGPYTSDISELEQTNPRVQTMVTELTLMRSHIVICILLIYPLLRYHKWYCLIANIFAGLIFTLGGRRHNAKINKILENYSSQKKETAKKNYQQQIRQFLS